MTIPLSFYFLYFLAMLSIIPNLEKFLLMAINVFID